MRVTCLTRNLGSGGAERQLCTLAVLLKNQGMDVSMLTYRPGTFFLPMIRKAGIKYTCIESRSRFQRTLALRRALRRGEQDVVLAFLEGPVFHAELAAIPRRNWGLVVSERSAEPGSYQGWRQWHRILYRVADYVTTNSHTNRLMIERFIPGMEGRVVTVYNSIDLDLFSPSAVCPPSQGGRLNLVGVGTYSGVKNVLGFVRAVSLARCRTPSLDIQLDWYGRCPCHHDGTPNRDVFDAITDAIQGEGLQDCVRLHAPSTSISDVYRAADAVVLPSFFEGLSNVACEALACGRPLLISNVSDAGNLVKHGSNGFLFDPCSQENMAGAIQQLAERSPSEREAMGRQGRQMAETMFNSNAIITRWIDILTAAAARKHIRVEHWVPNVPESAHLSLKRSC